ncbi:MAG: hypothetical protein VX939_11145 [Pseudomonadota bacterium]|nr:hypothetical protein [Pseudomonadota bacterium]
MYRERLVATDVHSENANRLKHLLLSYHDFRYHKADHPLRELSQAVADWQAGRLKQTHQDLYADPGYHTGLEFLLTDLYAPAGMTRRDDNIDRVFPKMVKWLPDHLLGTLAGLVELNLVTQRLDLSLAETLWQQGIDVTSLNEGAYTQAYRSSGDWEQRQRQLALVADTGRELDRYVRNRTLGWLLAMAKGPAEMADLSDLHGFLHRGYSAFREMADVEALIDRLIRREQQILDNLRAGHPDPFVLSDQA